MPIKKNPRVPRSLMAPWRREKKMKGGGGKQKKKV